MLLRPVGRRLPGAAQPGVGGAASGKAARPRDVSSWSDRTCSCLLLTLRAWGSPAADGFPDLAVPHTPVSHARDPSLADLRCTSAGGRASYVFPCPGRLADPQEGASRNQEE